MLTSTFIRRETAKSRHDLRDVEDLIMTPRCPCCRAWLIARVGKGGPSFVCLCRKPRDEVRRIPRVAAVIAG